MHKICITLLVVLCSLHVPKIIKLHQAIQMLQAKTAVGTTLVGPPCRPSRPRRRQFRDVGSIPPVQNTTCEGTKLIQRRRRRT